MPETGGPIIRFETVYLSRTPLQDPRTEELARWCGRFHEAGLTPLVGGSSAGNLSFRIAPGKNQLLITASGLLLKTKLGPDSFVHIVEIDTEQGRVFVNGSRPPSSECMVHYFIARARPDCNAVFHGHSGTILERASSLGLPVTPREEEAGTVALAECVSETAKSADSFIMKEHGFVCLGASMEEAGKRALALSAASTSAPPKIHS